MFTAKTPQEQALALDKAKYSESPTYGKTLLGLIKAYQLEELDGKQTGNYTGLVIATGLTLLVVGAFYFRQDIGNLFSKT